VDHRGGWAAKGGNGYYSETYSRTKRHGATLLLKAVSAKRLAIRATTCSRCGVINVFFGGKLLRTVDLRGKVSHKRRLIPVARFDETRTGALRVKVVSRGKLVRIDALGVSAV
jgi:hypothetical protein